MTILTGHNITEDILKAVGIKDTKNVYSFKLEAEADSVVRLTVKRFPEINKEATLEVFNLYKAVPNENDRIAAYIRLLLGRKNND